MATVFPTADDLHNGGLASASGLRIALFTGNYNYVREGANNALNRLVGHLLDRGAEVRVYSPTSRTPAFEPVGDLISVPSFPLPVRSEFRVALGLTSRLRHDLDAFDPNVVHVATPDLLGSAAQRFARRKGVPVVASFHTMFEAYLDYYGLGVLGSWAWRRQKSYYQRAKLVLVPSAAMRSHVARMGVSPASIRIWSRGIDPSVFTPSLRSEEWRAAHGFSPNDVIICFFGRVVREKGIGSFAKVIAELRRRGHGVRPLIIGDGPAAAEFRRTLGNCAWMGHLERVALGRALASADVFLNPSETETFGNVNREAMAAGLAVVGADVPSARAVVEHDVTGLLCTPEPLAFAEVVEKLLISPQRRQQLGRNGAMRASRANWTTINDAVVRAYRELVPLK